MVMSIVPGFAKRAHSNDDRDWNHMPYGWAFQAMPPTCFLLSCEDAQSPWDNHLAGENIQRHDIVSSSINSTTYLLDWPAPHPTEAFAEFDWYSQETPFEYSPGLWATTYMQIILDVGGLNFWQGELFKLQPNPFETWEIDIKGISGFAHDFGAPLVLRPAILYLP